MHNSTSHTLPPIVHRSIRRHKLNTVAQHVDRPLIAMARQIRYKHKHAKYHLGLFFIVLSLGITYGAHSYLPDILRPLSDLFAFALHGLGFTPFGSWIMRILPLE